MPTRTVSRRILLDRNVPVQVRRHLSHFTVRTTDDEGWSRLTNGRLLDAAEQAGFDVMLSADLRIKSQQNLAGRRLALVVISTPAWPVVQQHLPAIVGAIDTVPAGGYRELTLPRPPLRRRARWTGP